MDRDKKFLETIEKGYTFKGECMTLGGAVIDGHTVSGLHIKAPLKTLNRHGLISGATGTGKTKTLQIIAEQLCNHGIPVLLMDIKGDLSGIAAAATSNAKIEERHLNIGLPFESGATTVEFLSLSQEKGCRLRATVSEFGPVLFSKILGLNDTQGGVMALVFKYCDDNHLPLLDLKDVRKVLQYLNSEGKASIEAEYGQISSASVGAIMRKIVELEQQGADLFFGELSFDVDDLCRVDKNGKGYASILRLTDIQDKPKLFSTFMLQMLAEIYSSFPEEGDLPKPKLIIFIDEAHLVFQEASKALLNQIETIIKLIRSKGVGIFFCTQDPTDVPEAILGQLGMKVQHALRAFTAKDRKAIKLTAQNYPITEFYNTEVLLTQLGIGEALVSVLNEKGIPTPLVHTMLRAPQSRMDILTEQEIDGIMRQSYLADKYNKVIDRDSAHEILDEKMKDAESQAHKEDVRQQERSAGRKEKSFLEELISNPTTRSIGNTVAREVTRGILGVFGLGGRRTTTRKTTSARRK